MKRVINLHPGDNGAESVVATAEFKDRTISLKLDIPSYGSHMAEFTVFFNKTQDLRGLIDALLNIADEADKYFASNP